MRNPAINVAIKAARQAGSVILRNINRLQGLTVTTKSRNDYASEVDRNAEAEIIRELRKAFPTHRFLAEEGGATGRGDSCWVIDPLDGTSNYLRGFPHYCVSIALVEHDVTQLGVIYDPLRDELFTASRGSGAFLNDRRIRVSSRTGLDGALLCTGFPYRRRSRLDAHLAMCRDVLAEAEDIRRTGSAALDLAYVACGRLDGYFEMGLLPWDMAAGVLLVRESGGLCVDLSGGETFMDSGDIIASTMKLTPILQTTVRKHANWLDPAAE